MRKYLGLLLLPIILAGCILEPIPLQGRDLATAQLLPDSAAAKILGKYIALQDREYSQFAHSVTLVFYNLSYHDLGADDWASERLTLLAEKYPNSAHSSEGKSLLAKIGGAKPDTLLAKNVESAAPATQPAASPSRDQPSLAAGLIPSVSAGSFRLPSATALRQSFVSCRLGAWC